MRTENSYGLPAAADYSATKYRFAVVSVNGGVAQCSTAGLNATGIVGVVTNSPVAGAMARVEKNITDRIEAGAGGLAAGDYVKSDANGKGLTGATSGDEVFGVCIVAAAAGAIAQIMWTRKKVP